jgi:PleD family two-component response regulator
MTLQPRSAGSQLALIIGGGSHVLSAVEMLLDGPRWAVEFVAMNDEPYATVLAMRPDLVVVNLGLEEPRGFSLLSMLRLDPRTAAIPVLSYVPDLNEDADEEDAGISRIDVRMMATVGSVN